MKSMWDVEDDVLSGRLEVVLSGSLLAAAPIHAVYPHNRHNTAKVRLFVDYLAKRLGVAGRRIEEGFL